MAQKGQTEVLKRATVCPTHGSTHVHRLITPDAGEYFAAYYTPACCAAHEVDRVRQITADLEAHRADGGQPARAALRADRQAGRIARIVRDKGFGFLTADGGGDVFFHLSACGPAIFAALREGSRVTFILGQGPKGPRAEWLTREE